MGGDINKVAFFVGMSSGNTSGEALGPGVDLSA